MNTATEKMKQFITCCWSLSPRRIANMQQFKVDDSKNMCLYYYAMFAFTDFIIHGLPEFWSLFPLFLHILLNPLAFLQLLAIY